MVPPTYTIRNFHFILTQFPKLFKKQIEDKVKSSYKYYYISIPKSFNYVAINF